MRWCHICSQATMVCARGILAVVSTKLVRWGAAAPSDRGSARDRLLDAAERCLESCGVVGTTMEDIGRTAGVSRATVYRYFPNREAVMSGVIIRAAERYLDRINPGSRSTPIWAPLSSISWNTQLRPRAAKRSSDCCSAATRNSPALASRRGPRRHSSNSSPSFSVPSSGDTGVT